MLGLPGDRPLALVSFGGYGLRQLPLDRLDCLKDWDVVLTSRGPSDIAGPHGVHVVAEEHLYGAGLRYEDLVAAVDVVVTKPGYGIISDCVANDTAMLYTSRGRFVEYDVLVERDAALPALPLPGARTVRNRRVERSATSTDGNCVSTGAMAHRRRGGRRGDDRRADQCALTAVTSDQIRGTFTFSIDTGCRSACARNAGRSRSDLKPMCTVNGEISRSSRDRDRVRAAEVVEDDDPAARAADAAHLAARP